MNLARKLVTIVVVVHTRTEFLVEALNSCLGKAAQIIVVSDFHDLRQIVESVSKEIQYVQIPTTVIGGARNAGAELVQTPYFIMVDDDDRLIEIPESSVEILESSPEVGVVYFNYLKFGMENGVMLPHTNPAAATYENLLRGNFIYASSLIRKAAWDSIDGWRVIFNLEDWDFWIRIAKYGWKFAYVPANIVEYRVHEQSAWQIASTKNRDKLTQQIKEMKEFARQWIPRTK